MKKIQDKAAFGRGHFPAGTICEINSTGNGGKGPRIVTTTGLRANGYNSFVITTNVPHELTDTLFCNISHVTRIIKRGPGIAKLDRSSEQDLRQHNRETVESRFDIFKCAKPKSHYLSFDVESLVYMVANDYLTDNMLLDGEKMVKLLEERGMFKTVANDVQDYDSLTGVLASKKKLRKAVKQLINKCLRSPAKAQQEEVNEQYEQYKRDMAQDEYMYV
jgi:hypothetical protein